LSFIITPALICGAFAERMKFSTMVVFMILWVCWSTARFATGMGSGIFAYGTDAGKQYCAGGALDFAGGTVRTYQLGRFGPICALVLGKRAGYPKEAMPPHNLTYTALGAGPAVGGVVRLQRRKCLGRRRNRGECLCPRRIFRPLPERWPGPVVDWFADG